jgi:hypothetical protein
MPDAANHTLTIPAQCRNGATQPVVAAALAEALLAAAQRRESPDWRIINRAIIDRWNMGALNRIKRVAWKLARRNETVAQYEKEATGG